MTLTMCTGQDWSLPRSISGAPALAGSLAGMYGGCSSSILAKLRGVRLAPSPGPPYVATLDRAFAISGQSVAIGGVVARHCHSPRILASVCSRESARVQGGGGVLRICVRVRPGRVCGSEPEWEKAVEMVVYGKDGVRKRSLVCLARTFGSGEMRSRGRGLDGSGPR